MGTKAVIVLLASLVLVLVRFAEAEQPPAHVSSGSLVVTVPSRDGLIVGADSRVAVEGKPHCDDQFKIIEPKGAVRIAASAVGNVVFVSPPGPDESDFCKYAKRAQRLLDVTELVRNYLETETADDSTLRMEEFAFQCVAAVRKFHASSPLTLKPFAGRELFQVIVMGYQPKIRTAVVRDFLVRLSPDPIKPEAGKIRVRKLSFDSKRDMFLFGAANYFNAQVIGGIGRQFLSQETIRFIQQQTSVGKTGFLDAVTAAINVIDATSKTTALVPPRTGIGGPIDVLLLGNEPRPRRVRWKSQ